MPLRQWEIHDFPVPNADEPHPCVVISLDPICENPFYEKVNLLMCVSVRADYVSKARDVRLDEAAGRDGPTVVKCHVMLYEDKASAGARRGEVSFERRRAVRRTLQRTFGLFAD